MSLTPAQEMALKAELGRSEYDGLTESDASDRLHVTTQKAKTVPAELSVSGLLGVISSTGQANLSSHPMLGEIRRDIDNQDRTALGVWISVLTAGGVIDAADATNLSAQLALTTDLTEEVPPRILEAFGGVEGMPNVIDSADFSAAYQEVRG